MYLLTFNFCFLQRSQALETLLDLLVFSILMATPLQRPRVSGTQVLKMDQERWLPVGFVMYCDLQRFVPLRRRTATARYLVVPLLSSGEALGARSTEWIVKGCTRVA